MNDSRTNGGFNNSKVVKNKKVNEKIIKMKQIRK